MLSLGSFHAWGGVLEILSLIAGAAGSLLAHAAVGPDLGCALSWPRGVA